MTDDIPTPHAVYEANRPAIQAAETKAAARDAIEPVLAAFVLMGESRRYEGMPPGAKWHTWLAEDTPLTEEETLDLLRDKIEEIHAECVVVRRGETDEPGTTPTDTETPTPDTTLREVTDEPGTTPTVAPPRHTVPQQTDFGGRCSYQECNGVTPFDMAAVTLDEAIYCCPDCAEAALNQGVVVPVTVGFHEPQTAAADLSEYPPDWGGKILYAVRAGTVPEAREHIQRARDMYPGPWACRGGGEVDVLLPRAGEIPGVKAALELTGDGEADASLPQRQSELSEWGVEP